MLLRSARSSTSPALWTPRPAASPRRRVPPNRYAGVRAAKELERASRTITTDYIREAREAGHSWIGIGRALGAEPGPATRDPHHDIADAAFRYATREAPETARIYGRPFTWNCVSCDSIVADYGTLYGPNLDEEGHAGGCSRHIQAVAGWNQERRPPETASAGRGHEAGWEAGQ